MIILFSMLSQQSKIEKFPWGILGEKGDIERGEKSSKDMASPRNPVSTIGTQASPKKEKEPGVQNTKQRIKRPAKIHPPGNILAPYYNDPAIWFFVFLCLNVLAILVLVNTITINNDIYNDNPSPIRFYTNP